PQKTPEMRKTKRHSSTSFGKDQVAILNFSKQARTNSNVKVEVQSPTDERRLSRSCSQEPKSILDPTTISPPPALGRDVMAEHELRSTLRGYTTLQYIAGMHDSICTRRIDSSLSPFGVQSRFSR
ncbi:7938_t:CDS:2, partial [Acaulospora colombiana]